MEMCKDNLTIASANPVDVKEKADRCCNAIAIYLKTLQRENDYYLNKVKENGNI